MEITDNSKCTGCGACFAICPKHCIQMKENYEGFLYPIINGQLCVSCGLCAKVCPSNEIDNVRTKIPTTYAAKAIDGDIIKKSSSGGIFSLIAIEVLNSGGVVYGIVLSDDLRSAHYLRACSIEDLEAIRGSKYFQAEVENIYLQIKNDLKEGKNVLFSGTPCQINGLSNFLDNDYQNLICVEVICHGVPSKKSWEAYINYTEKRYNATVYKVNFREKKKDWNSFGLNIEGTKISYFNTLTEDPYLRIFLNNYNLRQSCYDCVAKDNESKADISLGDFWGVESILPEFNDNLGTSLILVNTVKGKEYIDKIRHQVRIKETDYEKAKKYNPGGFSSVEKPEKRNLFYIDLSQKNYKRIIKKYAYKTNVERIKNNLKHTYLYKLINTKMKNMRGGVNANLTFEYGIHLLLKK